MNMNSIVVVKPAGDKGLGLFATQDIRQGQRILEESPLLALSDVMASAHIWRDFQAMSKTDLAKFRDLSFHADAVSAAQVRIVHARLAQGGAEGGGLREMLADEMMMRAIFSCNCVSMGTAMQWGVGVFELYSRINHSCIPNVHHSYNPELNKEVVHATRDIVAGEEVLTSYTKLIRPHDLRRSELLRYGFACSCAACEGPAYREHERRRRRLCDIDQKFAVRDASSSLGGARARPSAASITKDLALAKENTTLLEEEGLSGMDLALSHRECANLCLKLGRNHDALAYANMERQVKEYCLGPETGYMLGDAEYALSIIQAAESAIEKDQKRVRVEDKRASMRDQASVTKSGDQRSSADLAQQLQKVELGQSGAGAEKFLLSKTAAKRKRRLLRKSAEAIGIDADVVQRAMVALTHERLQGLAIQVERSEEQEWHGLLLEARTGAQ